MKRTAVLLAALLAAAACAPASASEGAEGLETIDAGGGVEIRIDELPKAIAKAKPDLMKVAIGFYRRGKPLVEYRLGELVAKPELLSVKNGRVKWIAERAREADEFRLTTYDGQIYKFRISTGEISYLKKKYD